MHPFVAAAVGGAMIGAAASLLLFTHGRIAGISGIVAGLLRPPTADTPWRAAFVGGLLLSGVLAVYLAPAQLAAPDSRSSAMVVLAGILVGFGVRLGSGCTSGHGVCGLSRLSSRSLAATLTFISTGVLAASLIRVGGGL